MKKAKVIKTEKRDWKNILVDLEKKLNIYFGEKAPQLPKSIKDFIVKIGPYLALIGIILSLPAIVASIGIGAMMAPWALSGKLGSGVHFSFWTLFSLVVVVLEIMAIPGLFKRNKNAWNLLFYASLVGVISGLLSFNLGNLIIGTIISWYVLFQIRSYYK
ncbi:MAG: chromate transporter [Candidatus Shapirobacteria bacterium]|nr:chromate transporter [Candidatus Shapirobacteria bacterium]